MKREEVQERADRLVGQLEQWHAGQNRGPLARLRRGFSEATRHEAWPVLGGLFGELAVDHPVFKTVAGCFALHPMVWTPESEPKEDAKRNFGWTWLQVVLAEPKGREKMRDDKEPHTRFRRLLACHSQEDICQHVRHAVRLAKSKEAPVNYRRLFVDLWFWELRARTKVEWAKAYWQVPSEPAGFSLAGAGTPVDEEAVPMPE